MIDAREQVGNLLSTVCSNVKVTKPDGDVELPLVCYAQTMNERVNVAYDRIRWRVAVYASTFEELVSLTDQVDDVMGETLGFTRVSRSSDENAHIGTDLYLCRLDYSGVVQRSTGYVIKFST